MRDYPKCHEALQCTHCGATNRMYVIASGKDTSESGDDGGPPFESGTLYEVQECPSCRKIVLVGGDWHDQIEDPEEWVPKVLLPEPDGHLARRLLAGQRLDRECMTLALAEARKCAAENGLVKPKVGAVVARKGKVVASGYRGEIRPGEHAEYTVLEGKCSAEVLVGATVYTTLEPCTTRSPTKTPCVQRLVGRKVARVVVGMLDPDERIRGLGVLALRKANIRVDLFPPDLMTELEELNREFIVEKERDKIAPRIEHKNPTANSVPEE